MQADIAFALEDLFMRCPNCKADAISFLRLYARSGFGTFYCPACEKPFKLQLSVTQLLFEASLGLVVALLWFSTRSLLVSGSAFAGAVGIDAWMNYRLWSIQLSKRIAQQDESMKDSRL